MYECLEKKITHTYRNCAQQFQNFQLSSYKINHFKTSSHLMNIIVLYIHTYIFITVKFIHMRERKKALTLSEFVVKRQHPYD